MHTGRVWLCVLGPVPHRGLDFVPIRTGLRLQAAATHPVRRCLRILVSITTLPLFLRFRTGCHDLSLDQGRWRNRATSLKTFLSIVQHSGH